jgi:chemotaxis methyl-accepting protein methylase
MIGNYKNLHAPSGYDCYPKNKNKPKTLVKSIEEEIGFDIYNGPFGVYRRFSTLEDKSNKDEVIQKILGPASSFFRFGPRDFKNRVVKRFLNEDVIKVWSACCSHGCEPYTINMIFKGWIPDKKVKILATDIGKNALAWAEKGIWESKNYFETAPQKLLDRFFDYDLDKEIYKIKDEAREDVELKEQNVFSFDQREKFHIIFLNYVLPYFTKEKQNEAIRIMHKALVSKGVLYCQCENKSRMFFKETLNELFDKIVDGVYIRKD